MVIWSALNVGCFGYSTKASGRIKSGRVPVKSNGRVADITAMCSEFQRPSLGEITEVHLGFGGLAAERISISRRVTSDL